MKSGFREVFGLFLWDIFRISVISTEAQRNGTRDSGDWRSKSQIN